MRKQMLTKGMTLSASVDGYFVTKLSEIIKQNIRNGWNETVIIGHPKASTHYALKSLKRFINKHKKIAIFKTFSDVV
jgi:stage III sporulation protein SpoIIIAA